ncbi:hypothetical protein AHF37_02710 [Paragonimus kellicotti]|nr:hypothetical protein AHF37_02710 [Paragonimus kellicotti]
MAAGRRGGAQTDDAGKDFSIHPQLIRTPACPSQHCFSSFPSNFYSITDTNSLVTTSDIVDERQHSNTTEPASNKLVLWDLANNRFNLAVFCVMTGTLIVLSSLRSLSFFAVLINSAKRLHDGMLKACMNTRLRFFEINPSGRILNRFAKDIGQLDDYLPTTIHDFLQVSFSTKPYYYTRGS